MPNRLVAIDVDNLLATLSRFATIELVPKPTTTVRE